MMKKFISKIKSRKGSALLTVVIVMVVLILLGQAITVLTLSTLRNNVADSSNNEAFYAAESGIVSAIDQLKLEVVSYYQELEDATSTEFNALFGQFATNINTNAQTNFVEPELDGGSTSTTFYVGDYDDENDVCQFNIQCVSTTADNSRYQVNASVFVKKIDISVNTNLLLVPDNAALVVGGLLDLDYASGIHINGGDAYVATLQFETFKKNVVPYKIVGGKMYVDPDIGDSLEEPFEYHSYKNPNISNPSLLVSVNSTIDGGTLAAPSTITTLPGVHLTLNNGFSNSVIHGKGNVTITSGQYSNIDLYVDGNLLIDGAKFTGNIYCRGNVTMKSTPVAGKITCDGNVTFYHGSHDGTIISGGAVNIQSASSVSSIAAEGNINIESAGVKAGLIYSSGNISMGNCSITAVVYACGDVVSTGSFHLAGAIFAKEDFYFSNTGSQVNMGYDSEFVQQIVAQANIDIFANDSVEIIKPELDASIFVSENITPLGRVN